MTAYEPRGKVAKLLIAMQDDPARVWTTAEVSAVIEAKSHGVVAMLTYALRAEVIYRGLRDGVAVFSGSPFAVGAVPAPERAENTRRSSERKARAKSAGWSTDPDDLRIPRVVPGWIPPVMVPVRGTR